MFLKWPGNPKEFLLPARIRTQLFITDSVGAELRNGYVMRIEQTLRNCIREEDGAITVDWVVITACILVLTILVGNSIFTSVAPVTDSIEADLVDAADSSDLRAVIIND